MDLLQPEAIKGDILIVDDASEILQILFTMLAEQGYEVRRVRTGQQALNAVLTDAPDLILLDIRMPDMDGWEGDYGQRVRSVGALRFKLCLEAGMNAWINKPVRLEKLAQVLQRFAIKC